jgi:sugar lactone lactonase YvrE
MGVAVDILGNVYVADTLNSTIRKISNGKVETLAGKAGTEGAKDGNRSAASFFRPTGITIDSAFYLFVADTQNNKIRLVDQTGEVITIAGAQAPGSLDSYPGASCTAVNNCSVSGGTFNRPSGIAVNKLGDLFVADTGNNKIRVLTKTNPASK